MPYTKAGRRISNATIKLSMTDPDGKAITENLGYVPFSQATLTAAETDTVNNARLTDIANFSTAVNDLTRNSYVTTTATYTIEIWGENS